MISTPLVWLEEKMERDEQSAADVSAVVATRVLYAIARRKL